MDEQKTTLDYEVRLATKSDLVNIAYLYSAHFASDLTSRDSGSTQRLAKELSRIENDTSIVVVAFRKEEIIGAAIATQDRDFSKYESSGQRRTGYLSKNVVHESLRGQGIGRALVSARLRELKSRGVEVVYSSHHSDNIGSAKALDAFGFEYVESYLDLEKRPTGSRMTTVRRLVL